MAIDWTRLLQQALKHGMEDFHASRGAAADRPGGPTVLQIKADMSEIADWHHRQHHATG
jgi:hypothetical protein